MTSQESTGPVPMHSHRRYGLRHSVTVVAVLTLVMPGPTHEAAGDQSKRDSVTDNAARTPWGDPDLQGVYSNEDELNIPVERPDTFAGRTPDSLTADELAQVARDSNESRRILEQRVNGFNGLSPVRFDLKPSRAWLITEPLDGKIPALTSEGQRRRDAYRARVAKVPASAADFNLMERCVTLGLPRSMMPIVGGQVFRVVQSPGTIAIIAEMIHETRVVSLDSRPRLASSITGYMGDSRGHWESGTLVIETSNFSDAFLTMPSRDVAPATKSLRILERFRPLSSGALQWSVTLDDRATWVQPWTMTLRLNKLTDDQEPLEFACHEGNYGLRNILSAIRLE